MLVAMLAFLMVGVQALPGEASPLHRGDPGSGRATLLEELATATKGRSRVATKPQTGAVTFLGGAPDAPLSTEAHADHGVSAREFLDRYGSLYGVAAPASDLVEIRRSNSLGGGSTVRFQQQMNGLPIFGAEVAVQVGSDGRVQSSLGDTVPVEATSQISTSPSVPAGAAGAAARSVFKGDPAAGAVTTTAPELWMYDPVLLGARGLPGTRLVWRLEARAGDRRELVLVDAHSGTIALHFDQNAEARNRSVCDRNNVPGAAQDCVSEPARIEGGPVTGIDDVDKAYTYAGTTYDFYATYFGRDSLDDAGMPLRSTVRYCPASAGDCPYRNAYWTGEQMVYGDGFAEAEDVVGHELTHGVTAFTSRLFYYGQSGAINEAMSDIMGELINLRTRAGARPEVRWLLGEDVPLPGIRGTGATRDMADPTASLRAQPDRMQSPNFFGGSDDNAGVHRNSGVANKAAYLITDGGTFNGRTIAGIGETKTALVFYQAQTAFLGPSSVYADLANALTQACLSLIGTDGITAGDCTSVTKAVEATEMLLPPVTPGSFRPPAPVCAAGEGPTDLFTDDMEDPDSGNWDSSMISGVPWFYDMQYPASKLRSLHGPDLSVPGTLAIWRTAAVTPPPGSSTYLRFDHAYMFELGAGGPYDGGVIEYSTNGGGTWTDAGSLITDNGYDGTLVSGTSNPYGGREAFVQGSPGYLSTRLNLSSLAGMSVLFRFVVASDMSESNTGWFVDDVRVYTCEPAGPPSAPVAVSATPLDSSAFVHWQPPTKGGGSPMIDYRVTASPGGAIIDVPAPGTQVMFPGLVNGVSYTFSVKARNGSGFGPGGVSTPVVPGPGSGYMPITPVRILDTRDGTGSPGRFGPGESKNLTVADVAGIPANATAVAINMTVTGPSAASHLTVWPAGVGRPEASNLNFSAGETIPNLVKVKVGAKGQVSIFNNAGTVDVIGDAVGYYVEGDGDELTGVTPARVLDSRDGTGTQPTPWAGSQTRDVQVTDRGGVPASGVSAVVLNVTATGATAASHLTVWPADQTMPVASNLNFPAGATIANLVVAKVDPAGKVKIFNNAGNVNVIADVVGYFSGLPSGGRLVPITPARLLDSRDGTGGFASPWTAGTTRRVAVSGRGGVPPSGARAVVLNLTAVFPTAASHLTVWDAGAAMPTSSSLNMVKGEVIPNLVVVKLGADGAVDIFNNAGKVDVVADVVGFYT